MVEGWQPEALAGRGVPGIVQAAQHTGGEAQDIPVSTGVRARDAEGLHGAAGLIGPVAIGVIERLHLGGMEGAHERHVVELEDVPIHHHIALAGVVHIEPGGALECQEERKRGAELVEKIRHGDAV